MIWFGSASETASVFWNLKYTSLPWRAPPCVGRGRRISCNLSFGFLHSVLLCAALQIQTRTNVFHLCLWLRLFGGDSRPGQEQLFCLRRHSITVILPSTGDVTVLRWSSPRMCTDVAAKTSEGDPTTGAVFGTKGRSQPLGFPKISLSWRQLLIYANPSRKTQCIVCFLQTGNYRSRWPLLLSFTWKWGCSRNVSVSNA